MGWDGGRRKEEELEEEKSFWQGGPRESVALSLSLSVACRGSRLIAICALRFLLLLLLGRNSRADHRLVGWFVWEEREGRGEREIADEVFRREEEEIKLLFSSFLFYGNSPNEC